VNLFTAAIAVSVISAFQESIAELVALAVLMPIVASIGGNAGTQALTVAVRALAMRELNAANAYRRSAAKSPWLINGWRWLMVLGV
jgi:magnesium transporter